MKRLSIVSAGALAVALLSAGPMAAEELEQQQSTAFSIHTIGHVKKTEDRTLIVLDEKYEPGLLGLGDFSHVYVFWWFNRNDTPEGRAVLQVHPRGDRENPLTGVFATRSPRRPNLIALTLCKIVAVKKNVVEVEKIGVPHSLEADPESELEFVIFGTPPISLEDARARPREV